MCVCVYEFVCVGLHEEGGRSSGQLPLILTLLTNDKVDGRNPARMIGCLSHFLAFQPSKLVQDFFHPSYHEQPPPDVLQPQPLIPLHDAAGCWSPLSKVQEWSEAKRIQ